MTPRQRRTVIVGALLVAALLGWRVTPILVAAIRRAQDRALQAIALAERTRALVDRGPAIDTVLNTRADEFVALASHLWGQTPADGIAAMTASLGSWAAGRKVNVESMQPLPDSLYGTFRRVGLVLVGEGDLAGIVGLLRILEHSPQLLNIGRLALLGQGEPGASPQRLRFEAQVYGWIIEGETH